jgi:hypothetical protein
MHSKGNPINGSMIIQKAKPVYDEMKITDKCTFSVGLAVKFHVSTSVGVCTG